MDGPIDGREWSAQTGFYVRKHMDPKPVQANGLKSDVWWVRCRLGEWIWNAAEAVFELKDLKQAADYINEVRKEPDLIFL